MSVGPMRRRRIRWSDAHAAGGAEAESLGARHRGAVGDGAVEDLEPATMMTARLLLAAAVLLGYLLVHLSQHTLTPHFHFGEETHVEEMTAGHVGFTALLGLILHLVFSLVIAAVFMLAATRLSVLRRNILLGGLLYGVVVYFVVQ